jgi:hypothetical protein
VASHTILLDITTPAELLTTSKDRVVISTVSLMITLLVSTSSSRHAMTVYEWQHAFRSIDLTSTIPTGLWVRYLLAESKTPSVVRDVYHPDGL